MPSFKTEQQAPAKKGTRRDSCHCGQIQFEVVGELTGPWVEAPAVWTKLRKAQAAAAARPEFKDTVLFVETRHFVRPAHESPHPGHGHHEFGNAETYFLVGDALGEAMKKLCATPAKK